LSGLHGTQVHLYGAQRHLSQHLYVGFFTLLALWAWYSAQLLVWSFQVAFSLGRWQCRQRPRGFLRGLKSWRALSWWLFWFRSAYSVERGRLPRVLSTRGRPTSIAPGQGTEAGSFADVVM
jgi:hypothetical protein